MQLVHADPELIAAVGPRIRKSPFFDDTVRAGLTSVSCYNHMWLPMSYGDPDAEYRRLTQAVSMWDVAAQRHLCVSGPDADAIVQSVTAIDTSKVAVGTGAYAPMTSHDGVLINDPILLHTKADEWRFSVADADISLWVRAIAAERRADCTVRELDTATLAIQGPLASDVMGALDVDVDGMEPLTLRTASIDGVTVIVSRSGWSTEGGYEIFLDEPRHAARLWSNVETAGQPFGIGPGAPNPSERIENVLLSYGTDTGYHATPFELGLDDAIDLDGPDFIGREALLELRAGEPERRLMGVILGGERIGTLSHPVELTSAAETLGELRAAAWSPRFEANLGLALVRSDTDSGQTAAAQIPDGRRDVTIVALPFEAAAIDGSRP